MFGTDWPVIDPERAVKEIADLQFSPESHRQLMRENARAVFKRLSPGTSMRFARPSQRKPSR
jgi:predicted TIM-barrel fold metal-dependent hydrolase